MENVAVAAVENNLTAWAPDPIAVAQIHAGVIAIYFGLLTAFALWVFTTIRAAEDRIIEKAHAINRTVGGGVFFGDSEGEMAPEERQRIMSRLHELVVTAEGRAEDRGAEQFALLTKVVNSTPFLPMSFRDDGARLHWSTHRFDFRAAEGVRGWVSELRPVAQELDWLFVMHGERIQSDIARYAKAMPKDKRQGKLSRSDVLTNVAASMRNMVSQVTRLADEIDNDLYTYDSLVRRTVNKQLLIGGIFVGAAAFGFGVAIPMTRATPPVWQYVTVPLYCYFAILIFLFGGIWHYRTPKLGPHKEIEPSIDKT